MDHSVLLDLMILRLNNKVDELTKTFKLNTYVSLHNDFDNDDEKFYALNLPILKADEYIDLIFFGIHWAKMTGLIFMKSLINMIWIRKRIVKLIKYTFFFCKSLYSQQAAQNVMSKRIKKMFDEYFKKTVIFEEEIK